MSRDARGRILIAVTSCSGPLGGRPTGAWLGEVSAPWRVLTRAGFAVEYVSPAGGAPPVDPISRLVPSRSKLAFRWSGERARMASSWASRDIDPAGYDAIFFAGGHGTLWDFSIDVGLRRAAEHIWRHGGVIAAVCHGPAALLEVKDERGALLVTSRKVTAYSSLEERLSGATAKVPFLLEDELRKCGAYYSRGAIPFAPHVVVDGRLITGQNPLSARPAAEALARAVDQTRRTRRKNGARHVEAV